MSFRLAVATEDFGTPLKTAIAEAARSKVLRGLRFNVRSEVRPDDFSDTALRQLRHYVTERQLQVAGLLYPSRHSLHEPDQLDRRLQSIRSAMTLAQKLGTSELLIRCGRIPDPTATSRDTNDPAIPTNSNVDSLRNPFSFAPTTADQLLTAGQPTPAEQFATLCDILNDLVRYGNHIGCILQLQFASFHVVRIQQLLNEVKSGPVGIVFDPATAVMTGGQPVAVFRDLYRAIGYVRGRDARADVDGAGIEVPIGDGSVDWMELLATFAEADYQGWLCVERAGGDQRAEDVRHGLDYISSLLINTGS